MMEIQERVVGVRVMSITTTLQHANDTFVLSNFPSQLTCHDVSSDNLIRSDMSSESPGYVLSHTHDYGDKSTESLSNSSLRGGTHVDLLVTIEDSGYISGPKVPLRERFAARSSPSSACVPPQHEFLALPPRLHLTTCGTGSSSDRP